MTALETQAMYVRLRTAVSALHFDARQVRATLRTSDPRQAGLVALVPHLDIQMRLLDKAISSAQRQVETAHALTARADPTAELLHKTNEVFGEIRVSRSSAMLEQASTEGIISEGRKLL
jgi:hypothetical protein